MGIRCCKSVNISSRRNDLLKQDIPELSVVTGSVIALAVDINSETGVIFFKNACELVDNIVIFHIVGVISLVIICGVSCSAVFAGVIDNAKSAELIYILYRCFVIACSADGIIAVIHKP